MAERLSLHMVKQKKEQLKLLLSLWVMKGQVLWWSPSESPEFSPASDCSFKGQMTSHYKTRKLSSHLSVTFSRSCAKWRETPAPKIMAFFTLSRAALWWRVDLLIVVHSLSCVWLFASPWTAVYQAPLSFTISQSLHKFISIESVYELSNHLILCCPLLLLPSIFPSIRVFSSESALCVRWTKY